MSRKFESQSFFKRLKSMLKVDFRRIFTTRLLYIMLAVALVTPILVLVMTTMMDGSVSVNPQTGEETIIEGFKNAWHIIATPSSTEQTMTMDLTSMCNINMLYFIVSVLVCMFVSDDFRSGYSKILFTGRSKKTEYVISKTMVCFFSGSLMVIAWVLGGILGGKISGVPFELGTAGTFGLIMCIIAKVLLMLLFVSIFLLMSVIAKQKLWLSITLSLMIGMLFYMVIPMMSPLDAGVQNVLLCLVGGILFSMGFGAVSNAVLKKTDLV